MFLCPLLPACIEPWLVSDTATWHNNIWLAGNYEGSGDDNLSGRDGNDKLYGQAGVDLLYGGPGTNMLTQD
jgi:Ca2+-binding RTX toxin-like protein